MLVGLRSRRHIAPFTLHRPATVAEAMSLRAGPGRRAYLAGGTDLIDWLKQGHGLDHVIRLDGVAGLAGISGGDTVRIGAGATHAALIASAAIPDLCALWQGVANPRVRFAGTIGGNVMARKGEYDGLPALMALGAMADVAEAGLIALDRLWAEPGLLTGFVIAEPRALRLFADRTLRPALAVWLGLTVQDGLVRELRCAVAMAHPQPVCAAIPLELPLAELGLHAAEIAATVGSLLPAPATDGRASAGYRARMVGVLTRRILIGAAA